ncbi:MAG: Uma2 family endonuclease [Gemmataceae bacterium]|nr:Uma2 family endonuclease [Gemmataceae bacterium]
MTAAAKLNLISVEDYLAGELESPVKHEYVDGVLYAMAGARNAHNLIASNTLGTLHMRLRGKRCRQYNSDTKVRIRLPKSARLPKRIRFYYPDGMVVCRPNPQDDSFQDEPVLLVEVLTRKTRRLDEGEKKDAYLTIPSLGVYLLIEQDMPAVVAHRRTKDGFVREVYQGLDALIPLPEMGIELSLAEIYEDVEFKARRTTRSRPALP